HSKAASPRHWTLSSGELYLDLVAGRGARRQRARAPARHLFARPVRGVVGNGEEMRYDLALRLPPQPAIVPAWNGSPVSAKYSHTVGATPYQCGVQTPAPRKSSGAASGRRTGTA